jgi:predicted GNAT family acetyltransferase
MGEDTQVRDNPGLSRYEILVGDVVAGFSDYAVHGSQIDITHTEVANEFEGRGLASTLIEQTLDDVRRRGLQVMPYCPFVRRFIGKHAEYLDLVPAGRRAMFHLAD